MTAPLTPNDVIVKDDDVHKRVTNNNSPHSVMDLHYVPFDPPPKTPKTSKEANFDKRFFLPLYIATACIIFFASSLPPFLVIIWAVMFVGIPSYYFYNYHPHVCSGCCSSRDDCSTVASEPAAETSILDAYPAAPHAASV